MARRIDISSDREIAALRSIRTVLAGARRSSRLLRVRSQPRRPRALAARTHDVEDAATTPAATKARGFAFLAAIEARYGSAPLEPDERAPLAIDVLAFDRSALLSLARGNVTSRHVFERALVESVRIVAPATVLLDENVFDVVRELGDVVRIVAIDADIAMTAARLVALTRLDLPLDALTVACVPPDARAAFVTADAPAVGTFARAAGRTDAVVRVGRVAR